MHRGLVLPSPFQRWLIALALLVAAVMAAGDNARAQGPAGEWTTPAGDVQGTRFSPLSQINTTNVSRLVQEFQFSTGVEAGHEGAPLVARKTRRAATSSIAARCTPTAGSFTTSSTTPPSR